MHLYEHNEMTYAQLRRLFEETNKAAVVQPTGTGKSFVMLKMVEDNAAARFVIASPSNYIFSQIRTHAEEHGVSTANCEFITYSKLSQMEAQEMSTFVAEYIILDEFHRCGAAEWSKGVERLLETNPNAKVLGTSATPVRYLDSMRDMAQELFGGNYAVNMSLADAIRMKILPLPVYVTSVMSFSGDLARLEKRAQSTADPHLRHILMGKVQKAKRLISQQDCGLDRIFARHIPNKSGKYIVFCAGIERLNSAMTDCVGWFAGVNPVLHRYSVNSLNYQSEKEYRTFVNDTSDALKLLFCVDMLNEGVHLKDIDGVIMLRATQSANVFYQQLGRALSCSKSKTPVIFDIVNNYETGDTAKQYAQIMEIGRENGTREDEDISFELFDYVRDIRDILEELSTSFCGTWEVMFELLCDYRRTHDGFPAYAERYEGLRLGQWCSAQRTLRNSGSLPQERIDRLDEIGFVWSTGDTNWRFMLEQLREFVQKNNRLPTTTDSRGSEETKRLYSWCRNQVQLYKKGKLTEERATPLRELGLALDVNIEEAWQEKYAQLSKYISANGKCPTTSDAARSTEVYSVYRWMLHQREYYRRGKLSEERVRMLRNIGFEFAMPDPWTESYEYLREFVEQYGRFPKAAEKLNGRTVGQWFNKQKKRYLAGELERDKSQLLEQLGLNK